MSFSDPTGCPIADRVDIPAISPCRESCVEPDRWCIECRSWIDWAEVKRRWQEVERRWQESASEPEE